MASARKVASCGDAEQALPALQSVFAISSFRLYLFSCSFLWIPWSVKRLKPFDILLPFIIAGPPLV